MTKKQLREWDEIEAFIARRSVKRELWFANDFNIAKLRIHIAFGKLREYFREGKRMEGERIHSASDLDHVEFATKECDLGLYTRALSELFKANRKTIAPFMFIESLYNVARRQERDRDNR